MEVEAEIWTQHSGGLHGMHGQENSREKGGRTLHVNSREYIGMGGSESNSQ